MRKFVKQLLSIALGLCLLFVTSFSAYAAEDNSENITSLFSLRVLHIKTVDDFLEFSENCRLDTYSRKLVVVLDKDLDFSDVEFKSIPTFGGVFEGGHHTISGLTLNEAGSNLGLFRYLQETATVRNLTVEGTVAPSGSRNIIGGIAGNNAGKITNCHFNGTLTAADHLGGIVGINGLTGIIDDCSVGGALIGNHFIGGIAGQNLGVIRDCENHAEINTTSAQNTIELSDITIDTLTNSEAANTVTDIGGITGYSSGVIRNCQNHSAIGYKHMGYNIGGIAGSQIGYLVNCTNYGQIDGRKEVGGIVGQMEPAASIQYTEDTLQILKGQLSDMSVLTNRASANAQFSSSKISKDINALNNHAQAAGDALDVLLPDEGESWEDWERPDEDSRLAAENSLTVNMKAMRDVANSLSANAQHGSNVISRDMIAISNQVNAMSQTIDNAEENLGGSITDVSDLDTPQDFTGKVAECINYGAILADLNAGGIAGAMTFENDLDTGEDLEISGNTSLNFESEVRAVILNCQNVGSITIKKQNGGGIVGSMSLGLVKHSTNTGSLDGNSADYVGGIAGISAGYIRASYAKCVVAGNTNVGGVAGQGATISDCRSMTQVSGTELLGYILGSFNTLNDATTSESSVTDNYYLSVGSDIGAIDGISYTGRAESLNEANFFALENLPKIFQTVTLRFVFEDDLLSEISLTTGTKLDENLIPALPQKEGHTSTWENLDDIDLNHVAFDATITGVFTKKNTTLSSEENRGNGLPILLAEGTFSDEQTIFLSEATSTPPLNAGQKLLEGRSFSISDGHADALHYQPAGSYDTEHLMVLLKSTDGSWKETAFHADGRYIVFDVTEDSDTFFLVKKAYEINMPLAIACCAGAGVLIIAWIITKICKRRKQKIK